MDMTPIPLHRRWLQGTGAGALSWQGPTSSREGLGFCASSCVMSSLISARTSLLAARPRSVPNSESSNCACAQCGEGASKGPFHADVAPITLEC